MKLILYIELSFLGFKKKGVVHRIRPYPRHYRHPLFNLFEWFEDEIQCTWTSRGNSLFFPESPDQYIFLFLRGANTVSYTTYMYHRRLFHTNLFHTNIIIVVWKIVYETSACALYIVNRVQYVNNIHGNLNLLI